MQGLRRFFLVVVLAPLCLVLVSGFSSQGARAGTVQTSPATDKAQAAISTIVWGIIGYTRWPDPPHVLNICMAGATESVDAIRQAAELVVPGRVVAVRILQQDELQQDDALLGSECNVIYVGELDADGRKWLVKRLLNRPVLTIGERAAFCSEGGMFCLKPEADGLKFEANLDAIGRSSLRINPQVLRLSQRLQKIEP